MPNLATLVTDFIRDDLLIVGSVGVGCVMTVPRLERKSRFILRLFVSFAVIALWMTGTHAYHLVMGGSYLHGMVRYGGLFCLFVVSMLFWSHGTFCQALFAATISYSIQNMSERLIEIPRYALPHFPVLLDRFCLLALMAFHFFLYYRMCIADKQNRAMFDFSNMSSRVMLFLGAGVLGVSVVLDLVFRSQITPGNDVLEISIDIMSAIYSLLIILVSMSHLRETDSQRRAQVAAQMLHSEQRRYEQDKQVHDAINIKCHDIRHQIAALGEDAYGGELRKIGKLVDVYDAAPRTHCAALDVVLAGKTLSCNTQGIALTCLADGRRLGFMEDCDIYALFGNIMDNAIEAASLVEDEQRRMISLTVLTSGELMRIEALNFFSGELSFEEGLPVTTKLDRDYHGFGTRSIRTLTEKYGGDMQIKAEDGVFQLSILLPIPKEYRGEAEDAAPGPAQ